MNNAEKTVRNTHHQVNLTPKQVAKFLANLDKNGTMPDPIKYPELKTACWNWIRLRDDKGYGRVGINYKVYFAHRISFFIATKKWPLGKMICHRCDNASCCNPDHLYEGTAKTNTLDAVGRNRTAKGARHGSQTHPERLARGDRHGTRIHPSYMPKGEEVWNSRFKEDDVRKMKSMYESGEFKQWQIADIFKTRQGCISKILNGGTWKHVK